MSSNELSVSWEEQAKHHWNQTVISGDIAVWKLEFLRLVSFKDSSLNIMLLKSLWHHTFDCLWHHTFLEYIWSVINCCVFWFILLTSLPKITVPTSCDGLSIWNSLPANLRHCALQYITPSMLCLKLIYSTAASHFVYCFVGYLCVFY